MLIWVLGASVKISLILITKCCNTGEKSLFGNYRVVMLRGDPAFPQQLLYSDFYIVSQQHV